MGMMKVMYTITNWLLGGQLDRLASAIAGGSDE